jgi:hypothetical protein
VSTYLSIDLDFLPSIKKEDRESFYKILLKNKNKGGVIVAAHHYLLSDVNKRKYDKLINIDFHSDISDLYDELTKTNFNCGTWINYIKWRKNAEYIWVYPKKICIDDTDRDFSGLCHDCDDPFENKKAASGWKSVKREIYNNYKIDWKDVKRIGISASPDWIYNRDRYKIEKFIKILNIPTEWYHYEADHCGRQELLIKNKIKFRK